MVVVIFLHLRFKAASPSAVSAILTSAREPDHVIQNANLFSFERVKFVLDQNDHVS